MQRVERVEEFLLCPGLSGQELDIVHQQDVNGAVLLAEEFHIAVAYPVDQLIGEFFAGYVEHALVGILLQDLMGNRVHQMRLAKPHASVHKKRIVDPSRAVRDGQCSGMRELVGISCHEGIEGIFGVQGGGIPRRDLFRWLMNRLRMGYLVRCDAEFLGSDIVHGRGKIFLQAVGIVQQCGLQGDVLGNGVSGFLALTFPMRRHRREGGFLLRFVQILHFDGAMLAHCIVNSFFQCCNVAFLDPVA